MSTNNQVVRRAQNRRAYLARKKKREASAKDERRLSVTVRLRESLIGRLHRLVNEGIAAGRYPWKTMSECFSVLLVDGLEHRKTNNEEIEEMLPHLQFMRQIDYHHQMRREAQTSLNRARDEIGELISIGATQGAVNLYFVTLDALRNLPKTNWRDWALVELKKAFPDLALKKPGGIKLLKRKRR